MAKKKEKKAGKRMKKSEHIRLKCFVPTSLLK